MSLGSDLISGYEATAGMREKRKSREQDAALAAAARSLQLDLQAKQQAAQKALQDAALAADAQRQLSGQGHDVDMLGRTQTFQGGQADKERGFRTSERVGSQGFQAVESAAEREQREKLANAQLYLEAQRMKQGGDQFDTKMSWEKDPANPDNAYKAAHAVYLNPDGATPAPPVPPLPALPNAAAALQNAGTALKNNAQSPRPPVPAFGTATEGRRVIGPDGKTYIIKNGQPVPVQ